MKLISIKKEEILTKLYPYASVAMRLHLAEHLPDSLQFEGKVIDETCGNKHCGVCGINDLV